MPRWTTLTSTCSSADRIRLPPAAPATSTGPSVVDARSAATSSSPSDRPGVSVAADQLALAHHRVQVDRRDRRARRPTTGRGSSSPHRRCRRRRRPRCWSCRRVADARAARRPAGSGRLGVVAAQLAARRARRAGRRGRRRGPAPEPPRARPTAARDSIDLVGGEVRLDRGRPGRRPPRPSPRRSGRCRTRRRPRRRSIRSASSRPGWKSRPPPAAAPPSRSP